MNFENENQTLQELQDVIEQFKNRQLPKAEVLSASDVPVHVVYSYQEDSKLTVFENGLILYEREGFSTVFRLHRVEKDYEYRFCANADRQEGDRNRMEIIRVSQEEVDVKFYLMLFGEDRLMHNRRMYEQNHEVAFLEFKEDALSAQDREFDPGELLVRLEAEKKRRRLENRVLEEMTSVLTKRQMQITRMHYKNGMTANEIAAELELSRKTVWDTIYISIRKLSAFLRALEQELYPEDKSNE